MVTNGVSILEGKYLLQWKCIICMWQRSYNLFDRLQINYFLKQFNTVTCSIKIGIYVPHDTADKNGCGH